MRLLALVGLLVASTCWAQEPALDVQQPPSDVQAQAPAAAQNQTITIPFGTRIPLSLVAPITTKSRSGDGVRAVTTFPVTVGAKLAIPVGTYIEGVIDKVKKGGRSGPSVQMHFTHIVYANGYTVDVDGANAQAKALSPNSLPSDRIAFARDDGAYYAMAAQQLPPPAPLPKVGPSIGTVVGITVGATVAGIVALVLLGHHQGGGNGVLFDTGWQFEMVLQSPLTVDAASVAAAGPNAQ